MSFVMVATGAATAVTGIAKAISGGIKAKKAKENAEKAQIEIDKQKNAFENLDTSNPYKDMENVMEDLTVNTQAAEFQKQQQEQQRANIMQSMQGAAGSSGIAALAQSLANQGSLDSQKASADIARQEQANQMAERNEAAKIQQMEREGDLMSRQMQSSKISSLMGLAAADKSAALQQQVQGQAQMYSGITSAIKGGSDLATGIQSLNNPAEEPKETN